MNASFWRGRRVFITGHTGFKGGWLAHMLHHLGAETAGYALAPDTTPPFFADTAVASAMTSSTIGDIRDAEQLHASLRDARPAIVLHLAAQPLVRASYEDPVGTYATNIMGTVHLLEAVRRVDSVRAVVVVTTDKVYENRGWPWGYRENDRLGGHDPYSSSKACAELAVAAWRSSFFDDGRVAIASARAGNVIGGGDRARDRLVPDLVRGAETGTAVLIRNPRATRPWQHVLDPLAGYLRLAEALVETPELATRAWNFGPPSTDERTVEWMATEFVQRWGDGARWEQDPGSHPHEARLLALDSTQAMTMLGWRPKLDAAAALDWSIEWYRVQQQSPATLRSKTLEQIDRYLKA